MGAGMVDIRKHQIAKALLSIGFFAWASGALSGPVIDPTSGISEVHAGAFCPLPPDRIVDAPDATNGKKSVYNEPYKFARSGENLVTQSGIGIGVVVIFATFQQGEDMRARFTAPGKRPSEFYVSPDVNGRVWFGANVEEGMKLAVGVWKFELLRAGAVLMTYDLTVVPSSTDSANRLRIDCSKPVA
jgi:hypothetical protein